MPNKRSVLYLTEENVIRLLNRITAIIKDLPADEGRIQERKSLQELQNGIVENFKLIQQLTVAESEALRNRVPLQANNYRKEIDTLQIQLYKIDDLVNQKYRGSFNSSLEQTATKSSITPEAAHARSAARATAGGTTTPLRAAHSTAHNVTTQQRANGIYIEINKIWSPPRTFSNEDQKLQADIESFKALGPEQKIDIIDKIQHFKSGISANHVPVPDQVKATIERRSQVVLSVCEAERKEKQTGGEPISTLELAKRFISKNPQVRPKF